MDYYEIAPLNDPSEAQKGVLSRGGLVIADRAYLRDCMYILASRCRSIIYRDWPSQFGASKLRLHVFLCSSSYPHGFFPGNVGVLFTRIDAPHCEAVTF